ncbi:MAG: hypothetical protein A4E24_01751 [Methanomethylovorans sp. PtaU1.Bin093]|nr:MAG: hypothetical protein A4E24_01751 [Methanomethylovorans sp. PtaU1.Bin093]
MNWELSVVKTGCIKVKIKNRSLDVAQVSIKSLFVSYMFTKLGSTTLQPFISRSLDKRDVGANLRLCFPH